MIVTGADQPNLSPIISAIVKRPAGRDVPIPVTAKSMTDGGVLRDLFEHDNGGYLQDVALLDRLVTDKLKLEAEQIATEGWKWISVAVDLFYGHAKRASKASISRSNNWEANTGIFSYRPMGRKWRGSARAGARKIPRCQSIGHLRRGALLSEIGARNGEMLAGYAEMRKEQAASALDRAVPAAKEAGCSCETIQVGSRQSHWAIIAPAKDRAATSWSCSRAGAADVPRF